MKETSDNFGRLSLSFPKFDGWGKKRVRGMRKKKKRIRTKIIRNKNDNKN